VIDHETCEALPVDENDLRADNVGVLLRLAREFRSRDEDAFVRALPLKGTRELLNFWSSDCSLSSFGLNVDYVQTEFVFFDDPVDTLVSATANGSARVLSRATISHSYEKVDNEALKERR
jgi:hypothetical protein